MNILVTADSNYILPLKIMLYSLFKNNPGNSFNIILLYSEMLQSEVEELNHYIGFFAQTFTPVFVTDDILADAPVVSYYSKVMYYRLLAFEILPPEIGKVLYLDPDILAINPIAALYDTDISHCLFGACAHNSPIVDGINKVRLQTTGSERYFNSGVLLMNLKLQRKEIRPDEIFAYIKKNENILILPDQDVLNGLYGHRTALLDDSLYNYDVRKSSTYFLASAGEKDVDWVVKNTIFLHFCGKQKPWRTKYRGKFGPLYKHYQHLADMIYSELN